MILIRISLIPAVLLAMALPASAAGAQNGAAQGASAGTNSGPTQTVVVNGSTNPVPVRDLHDSAQNRMTLLTWKTGTGTSWTGTIDYLGRKTALSELPPGKLFIVTDIELEATGPSGTESTVLLLHSTTSVPEFESILSVDNSQGRVTERFHLTTGPAFADLPAVWFAGGTSAAAMVWGYLVDAY